jgi:diguanylate cyclase (GGDEF)-like protein
MENDNLEMASQGNDNCMIRAAASRLTSDIMLQITKSGVVLEFKGQKEKDLFVSSDEIIGKSIRDIMPADLAESVMNFVEKALETANSGILDYQLLINIHEKQYEATFIVCADDKILIILHNISEHKKKEEQIHYLFHHDTLTSLANRYLLRDHMELAIANAKRKNRLFAIALLDLDNFKNINDTIGHTAGDRLLQGFADRLSKCIRQTDSISRLPVDGSDVFLARLGGDEFALLLSEVDNIQDPAKVCNRVLEMLSEPFVLDLIP